MRALLLMIVPCVSFAAVTGEQANTARIAAENTTIRIIEVDSVYWVWSKASVNYGSFTLHTCAATRVDEALVATKNQPMNLWQLINLVTPSGWRTAWTNRMPPPENLPAWCL